MAVKRVNKTSRNGKRYHMYYIDGQHAPGVTTILNGALNKPALLKWAPKAVAEWVADHLDEVTEMKAWNRDDVVKELKETPWRQRDEAADRGTEVHSLAERLVKGELVEVPEALSAHVDHYIEFLNTWNPKPVLVEATAVNRRWHYCGQLDLVADLPNGERALLDLKTGKGVYGNHALQFAGYRHCDSYLDDNDREQSMSDLGITSTYIVHVTGEDWNVYPVEVEEQQYRVFQHLLWIYRNGSDDVMKGWLGEPTKEMAA